MLCTLFPHVITDWGPAQSYFREKGSGQRTAHKMVGPIQVSEPLLDENPNRFCMFPIKYNEVWEMYKKAEASFWTGLRSF